MENQETKLSSNNMPMIIVAAVAGVIILAGIGFVLTKPTQTSSPEPIQQAMMNGNAIDSGTDESRESTMTQVNAQVISVEGGSYYFKPNEIRVKKDQKVRIELKAVSLMHDFVIDELNVRTEIVQSGDTGVVEFTPDQAGEFEFYCSVGNHRQLGMIGKLIVE